jgi:hypothetical protein
MRADLIMNSKVRSPAAGAFDVVVVGLVEPHSKAFLARLLSDGGGVALPKTGPRGASPVDPIIQRATTPTGCMRFFATYSPILWPMSWPTLVENR